LKGRGEKLGKEGGLSVPKKKAHPDFNRVSRNAVGRVPVKRRITGQNRGTVQTRHRGRFYSTARGCVQKEEGEEKAEEEEGEGSLIRRSSSG